MMCVDNDLLYEYKCHLADRYTAEELVELLKLTEWDILEMFSDKVMELRED